jgi:hypothetical protein
MLGVSVYSFCIKLCAVFVVFRREERALYDGEFFTKGHLFFIGRKGNFCFEEVISVCSGFFGRVGGLRVLLRSFFCFFLCDYLTELKVWQVEFITISVAILASSREKPKRLRMRVR